MCSYCLWSLNLTGYVTPLGADVQRGLQTSGGPCGHVLGKRVNMGPKQTKVQSALLLPGELKIRATVAPEVIRNRKPNGKWCNLEKTDLQALAQLVKEESRPCFRVYGPVLAGAPCLMTAKNDYMAAVALVCRMFQDPPPPEPGTWDWATRFTDLLWPGFASKPEAFTIVQWLESMPSHRRLALTAAAAEYARFGWNNALHSKFKSFIKDELLPAFTKHDGALLPLRHVVARLINAPNDVAHCIAGPKIKPFMAWLKHQWHEDNFIFYGSTGPDALGRWLKRFTSRGPRFYFWSDYTSFDSSHSHDSWSFVERFYSDHMHDKDFARVLQAWRTPSGVMGNLKFAGRTMNASGRDDTAFANAVLNGTAMFLSVTAAWLKKELRTVTKADVLRVSDLLMLSVCGDDALGSLPYMSAGRAAEFLTSARANIARFGFQAKMYGSDRVVDCVYLGHRPYLVGGEWYWGKTLGRCLYKLGYQTRVVGDAFADFHGVCQMHQACSAHVPVLSEITQTWLAAASGGKVNAWVCDPNKPWQEMGRFGPDHYDDSTLENLALAYSVDLGVLRGDLSGVTSTNAVTADDFRDLISYVRSAVTLTPCVLDHWLLRHMVLIDEQ